jgi:REP element-mobilizing transposase RayT
MGDDFMPRQARLDTPGTLHHVIVRGIEKKEIVTDNTDRKNFITRLGTLVTDTDMEVYAWALMTNHAHILIRSGIYGLSRFMRRFLTGYAISYNRCHKRYGHLFQNRYKSIVCEEDIYLKELVRYIHLNPLRARLVKNLAKLDRYPFCGHSVIVGKQKNKWQNREYVLRYFGKKESKAIKRYRKFVIEGIEEGKRPDLVGGGLIRSQGGWSQVISMRRHGNKELSDERVLGSGDFVERVIKEADKQFKYQFSEKEKRKKVEQIISDECRDDRINIKELRSGSRRHPVCRVRFRIAIKLFSEYGIPITEIARNTGVSASAVSKMVNKSINK